MIAHDLLTVLLWIIVGGAFSGLAVLLLNDQTRFKERCIDDVGDFLQKTDEVLLETLLDPMREAILRFPVFRDNESAQREQRSRLEKLRNLYRREYNNARINKEWGDTEWKFMTRTLPGYDPEFQPDNEWLEWRRKITVLRQTSTICCVFFRIALIKMWFLCFVWSCVPFLWRIMNLPSVATFRHVLGVDLLLAYQQLKDAVAAASLDHGAELSAELMARM